ncbi:leucine-rich repeat protein [Levilactobacillus angrenensis]|uniref:Leucine-rich repeat protein n=1 Tax=Levilactobacillus angrenensis TaxID=2486020 RepID=A0ABW1UBQ0_9LACO|nr:leucine-rich repeat protein [Levilactobacillus angrenensis]
MRSSQLEHKTQWGGPQRKWFYAGLTVVALGTGLVVNDPRAQADATPVVGEVAGNQSPTANGQDDPTGSEGNENGSVDDGTSLEKANENDLPDANTDTGDQPQDPDTDESDEDTDTPGSPETPEAEDEPLNDDTAASDQPQNPANENPDAGSGNQPADAPATTVQQPVADQVTTSASDFDYAQNDDGSYTVTGFSNTFNGGTTVIAIPDFYQGQVVSEIGDNAFNGQTLQDAGLTKLTQVTIGKNVHAIGADAFADNELTTVKFSGTWLYIHDGAFKNNRLADLDLSGVAQIWQAAFRGNPLTTLTLPDSVEMIGASAFADCNLTQLTLDDKLISVDTAAFAGNQIQGELTIPDSLTDIGDEAFSGNNLTGLSLGKRVKTIGTAAFANNQLAGTVVISDSVTRIGERAFSDNQLTGLTLGQGVQTIGAQAFRGNGLAGTLAIPACVQDIGDEAFDGAHLTGLTFAKDAQLNRIGVQAFENNQLTTLALPDSVTNIETGAFSQNQLTGDLKLPASLTNLGDFAFVSNYLEQLIVNDRLEKIGTGALANNQLAGDLILPATLTNIGDYAFANNRLASVTLDDQLATIGDDAFLSNQLTGTLILPDSLTNLGAEAFKFNQLTGVQIGSGLEEINDGTFENNQIWLLTLPEKIATVGESAFAHNNLVGINIERNDIILNRDAFAYNDLQGLNAVKKPWIDGENAFSHQSKFTIKSGISRDGTTVSGVRAALTQALAINGDALRELSFVYNKEKLSYNEATDTLTLPAGWPTGEEILSVVFTSGGQFTGQMGFDNLRIVVPALGATNSGKTPTAETDPLPGETTPEAPTTPGDNNTTTTTPTTTDSPATDGGSAAVTPQPSAWTPEPHATGHVANRVVNQLNWHRNADQDPTYQPRLTNSDWTWSAMTSTVSQTAKTAGTVTAESQPARHSVQSGRPLMPTSADPTLPQTNDATTPWQALGLALLAGLSWLGVGLRRRH